MVIVTPQPATATVPIPGRNAALRVCRAVRPRFVAGP